jgi:SAM-dependent methyltransferase
LARIYPADYHAYEFSPARYGFVYRVRRRLEARRALSWCRDLPADAHILDVGCGDGFHLRILRDFGPATWRLEGLEPDAKAVAAARSAGLTVHRGTIQEVSLPEGRYDLLMLIATIEHVDNPVAVLQAARALLKPGGRLIVVTDNADTYDFALFGRRHWGGYHFPRHWQLFTRQTLSMVAERSGLEVVGITTAISPVNWVYSVHNALTDWGAPEWLRRRFGLHGAGALTLFTLVDSVMTTVGRGALLRATFRRPR